MPAALKLTVSKAEPLLRGQDHVWRVIRALGADDRLFTTSQVMSVSQEPQTGAVTTFLRRLLAARFIERDGFSKIAAHGGDEHRYRLLKAPERTPRISRDGRVERPKTARQHMWNIMRGSAGRSGFSYRDLMVLASTEDTPIAANTAKSYIQELKGGYLLQLDPGGPNRPAIWRLRPSMNTGPLPPMILRAKVVYDQNRGRLVGDCVAQEESE